MKTLIIGRNTGMSVVYTAQVELEQFCEKVFYFNTRYVPVHEVRKTVCGNPLFIQYILSNPEASVGVIIDNEGDSDEVRNAIINELNVISNDNITTVIVEETPKTITAESLVNMETKSYSIKTIDLLDNTDGDVRILVKAWEYEGSLEIIFDKIQDAEYFVRVAFGNECVQLPLGEGA